jgi:transposase
LRQDLPALWERETPLPSGMARGFCNDGRKIEPARWTFGAVAGGEPTNNAAGRAFRPAVQWRQGCFAAASANGNTLVAKILTTTATCRQQNRHLLPYLTAAIVASRNGQPAPSLVPV